MSVHTESSVADEVSKTLHAEHVRNLLLRWRENPEDMAPVDELVASNMYLVEAGVRRVCSRLPRHVNREELHAAALGALYISLQNFDPRLGTSFEGYARKRIHGAIMDLLRCLDGVPRNSRRASRKLILAAAEFRGRTGRTPCQEELAGELSLTTGELSRLESQARMSNRLSLDAAHSGGQSNDEMARRSILMGLGVLDNPLETMVAQETRDLLVSALETLPERQRAILVLHYNEGIRFNEIAEAMGVSEARISQLHSAGIEKLRECMVRGSIRKTA